MTVSLKKLKATAYTFFHISVTVIIVNAIQGNCAIITMDILIKYEKMLGI